MSRQKQFQPSPPTPADASDSAPRHPGEHVRVEVLDPRGLTVTGAAKLVGVGRPAFSNFLNGRAAVTPKMASRLEVTFGVPAQALLDMQAAFDAASAKAKGTPVNATPYAVPFLGIRAREIEAWATRNISARSRLAVFLRTSVNSTGRAITRIDFPGNDDAERLGWDGEVETSEGTPWIPAGRSGWEFGTNEEPKSKADGDYAKSTRAVPKVERERMTFVFVTPRHWPGKREWVEAQRSKRQWRDVRVYDSSDLEQWVEQSIAAQAWFAHETGRPSKGVRTLNQCWADWANVSDRPLPCALFAEYLDESTRRTVTNHLTKEPERPLLIAADSTDEALAFLAHFFDSVDDPRVAAFRDRVLVFDEPGVAKDLARGTTSFVAVAHSREVERELAPLMRSVRCIVVYPRNAANVEPSIVLEPLSYEAFHKPLEEAGCSRDEVTRLDSESGRSLTVLRRRLATVPAIRTPHWAADHDTAHSLVPFLWAGAWNVTKSADRKLLALMADEDTYEPLERQCQRLARVNEPPVWSVGHYCGVVSKIDVLFAIAPAITRSALERFFSVAEIVLSEDDPKLDLPEDKRWAAAVYGKSREYSRALRQGIAETLVLLAVYGNGLLWGSTGFDCAVAARALVRKLLTPLKTRLLEANDNDLTAYAEASPDEFLSIIEADLQTEMPETYGLMRPVGSSFFGGCPRTGLLWALEGLAWHPDTMPRVALILAQLSQIEINDNWMNKPFNSLESIFRAWMPQTAANHAVRLRVMQSLAARFSPIAWKVCVSQLAPGPRMGSYSHKPKWRNDGHGFGEPFPTVGPVHAFVRDMIDMALNWKHAYSRDMLSDLIDCQSGLTREHQTKAWKIVAAWAQTADDGDKAFVREQIRRCILSRRGKRGAQADDYVALTKSAKVARAALEPTDIVQRYEWLFRAHWLNESAEEFADLEHSFEKREERVAARRTDALREVYAARGIAGVVELSDLGDASFVIGWLLATRVLAATDVADAVGAAHSPRDEKKAPSRRSFISGLIRAIQEGDDRMALLTVLKAKLTEDDFVRVLLAAPFRRETWQRVDELSEASQRAYWLAAQPEWNCEGDEEAAEGIERLIAARRPRAAFASANYRLEKFDPELLFRLLNEIATGGDEEEGQYRLSPHEIEVAFLRIGKSPLLTLDQKAGLEFAYVDALAKPRVRGGRYGIPNLEEYIEAHPDFFVQAIVWVFRRKDGVDDPPEYAPSSDPEHGRRLATRGYQLLTSLEAVPGHNEKGELDAARLGAWVKSVREACADLGRLQVADVRIGEMLAHAPPGSDGVWPCGPVRDVLEDVHSPDIMRGAHTGLYNERGVHWRGEGGAQERDLAAKYRAWATALQDSHPFVSSLHQSMGETYEREARREDTEATIRRRLH